MKVKNLVMIEISKKQKITRKVNQKPLVIALAVVVILALAYYAARPLRYSLAKKYLDEGSHHLSRAQYLDAIVDFRKCELLSPGLAREELADASEMQNDITAGDIYIRQYDNVEMLNLIKEAEKVPESDSAGLLKVKELLQNNHPQVAEIAANIVIEMDSRSAKAWAYYGIAKLSSALSPQMTEQGRKDNLAKAKEALSRSAELDGKDQLVQSYLKEIDKYL